MIFFGVFFSDFGTENMLGQIDLYRQTSAGTAELIGVCHVPLANLLGCNGRICASFSALYLGDGKISVAATIDIIVRMFRPVVSQAPSPSGSECGLSPTGRIASEIAIPSEGDDASPEVQIQMDRNRNIQKLI